MAIDAKHTPRRADVSHYPDCRAHPRFGIANPCTCGYALYAAAPELLEALRDMLKPHDCRYEGESMTEPCPIGERARAVIAAATRKE